MWCCRRAETGRRVADCQCSGRFHSITSHLRPHFTCFDICNAQAQGNIQRQYTADIQRDMYDLQGLKNNSVSAIYTRYAVAHTAHHWELLIVSNLTSHTLEHNSFGDGSLENTLAGELIASDNLFSTNISSFSSVHSCCRTEWYRVLRPGGLLLVSVPNLHTLAKYVNYFPCGDCTCTCVSC